MKRAVIAATLSLAVTGASLAGAASIQDKTPPDPKIGTRVTITGCLHQGTTKDAFVLLGVTERPADSPAQAQVVPYAIYFLDSNDGLKELVGEVVDVTGKVTSRRSQSGTITVAVDPSDTLSTEVEIASGSKVETTEKFAGSRPRGAPRGPSSMEVTRPVYRLDVEHVRSVVLPVGGPACK